MTQTPPPWTERAACTPHIHRGEDWWHPDDELPSKTRTGMFAAAREVCITCPVRRQCGEYGLELLESEGVDGMFGGMDPAELRGVARALGRPARKIAQHGSRARYVNYRCSCPACRRANAVGENRRRRGVAA